jgi:hypothetical protein
VGAPPLLHGIWDVRDLHAEDERQARGLDLPLIGLGDHPGVRDDRHVWQVVSGHERLEDRQHGLDLSLVPLERRHHQQESVLAGEQASLSG